MKRIAAFLIISILSISAFNGCGNSNSSHSEAAVDPDNTETFATNTDESSGEETTAIYQNDSEEFGQSSSENNDTQEEPWVVDIDVRELDKIVETYKSYEFEPNFPPKEMLYKFTDITSGSWQTPDLLVLGDDDFYQNIQIRVVCLGRYNDKKSSYRTLVFTSKLYNTKSNDIISPSNFRLYSKYGTNELCIQLYSDLYYENFGTLEYLNFCKFYDENDEPYIDNKYLSRTLSINYGIKTGKISYHNPYVSDWENDETYYNRARDVQLEGYSLAFTDSDMYYSIEEAYEAYLKELPWLMGYPEGVEVNLIH